jgi:uncharacterized coiled-coil protein SlyX
MKKKQKYTEILKEVVRNEAVSSDKLRALADKHGGNKGKIINIMTRAGVVEEMGRSVYRVMIRDKNIDEYVGKCLDVVASITQEKKDSKDVDSTYIPLSDKPYEMFADALKDDPNTHARAEAEIDFNARLLEMMNAHMDKVQINTNKQNEYIATLEKRIEFLEQYDYSKEIDDINTKVADHGNWLSDHDTELATLRSQLREQTSKVSELDAVLVGQVEKVNHQADKLAAMQVRLDAQLTYICEHRGNGNVLRALHQLLGELI